MDTSQFQKVEAGLLIATVRGKVKLWEFSRKGPCVDDVAPIRSHALVQAGHLPAVSYIRGCLNLAEKLFGVQPFDRIEGRLYTSDSYNAAGDVPWLVSVTVPLADSLDLDLSISWRLGMTASLTVGSWSHSVDVPVGFPSEIALLSGLTDRIINPFNEDNSSKHLTMDRR